jgi:hypothetical protein
MIMHFLFMSLLITTGKSFSQADTSQKFFAFRINDYKVKLNDSVIIVQVSLPDAWPLRVQKGQMAVLKHRFESGKPYDTSIIGWGRCDLIKSNYYYFGIHHDQEQEPQQGDLLYTKMSVPVVYNGVLYKAGSHAISFTKVDESQFYYNVDIFSMQKEKEAEILDSMAADIQFTGKAMLKQSPEQDRDVKGGIYDGKKLFTAMQQVKRSEVEEFLNYVIAWHGKYAGNVWKISEVFATWMINATPAAKKEE